MENSSSTSSEKSCLLVPSQEKPRNLLRGGAPVRPHEPPRARARARAGGRARARAKGEGRRAKGEGRRAKGDGRWAIGRLGRLGRFWALIRAHLAHLAHFALRTYASSQGAKEAVAQWLDQLARSWLDQGSHGRGRGPVARPVGSTLARPGQSWPRPWPSGSTRAIMGGVVAQWLDQWARSWLDQGSHGRGRGPVGRPVGSARAVMAEAWAQLLDQLARGGQSWARPGRSCSTRAVMGAMMGEAWAQWLDQGSDGRGRGRQRAECLGRGLRLVGRGHQRTQGPRPRLRAPTCAWLVKSVAPLAATVLPK